MLGRSHDDSSPDGMPLLAAYAAGRSLPADLPQARRERLEGFLADMHKAARAVWPTVHVAEAAFARYLGEHLGDCDDDETELKKLRIADLYLACACVAQCPAALRALDDLLTQTAKTIARVDGSEDFRHEVVQLLRHRLLLPRDDRGPRIGEYAGKGSLSSWLRMAAAFVAVDLKRSRKEASAAPEQAGERLGPDPELDYLRARYKEDFAAAFSAAIARLSPRDRTLMRMRFGDGLPIEAIAHFYGVHRTSINRWLGGIRDALLVSVRAQLSQKLGAGSSTLDSLLRLLPECLEIDISQMLAREQREDATLPDSKSGH